MIDIIAAVLIVAGVLFMLVASIGIIRLPDFYTRMSVVTKASTIGLGLIVAGAGIYFNTLSALLKMIAIILFIVATSPISAHIITKAASLIRVAFWDKTDLTDYLKARETPDDPKKASSSYGE